MRYLLVPDSESMGFKGDFSQWEHTLGIGN